MAIVSTQQKVRQCSQCQENTEFYCNTCKYNLCQQCKERHVIDLDTKFHDVVIYREKYEYIPKQETCVRHPGKIYELYCPSCELPVCFQCKERHETHNIVNIRTAYKTNRHHHKEIIQNIRSDIIYNSYFLLAGIKTDVKNRKTCQTKISNLQIGMSEKGQKLKIVIDNAICDILHFMSQRLPQQKRKMTRYLVSIENYMYKYRLKQTANRPVQFLLFLKEHHVHKIKDTPNLAKHARLCMEIKMKFGMTFMSGIQIIESGKRQATNECLLKRMYTPVLKRCVIVEGKGMGYVSHISHVTPDQVWISDWNNLILANMEGNRLHHLTDILSEWGVHTVNITCELIYIDRYYNIKKLSRDNRTLTTLIEKTEYWEPRCVKSSSINGDLLVGMRNTRSKAAKVTRFNDKLQFIQTIQHKNIGQIYSNPVHITENCNGDVIVSDWDHGALVVTDSAGRYRFSYPESRSIYPRGVCTDVLSNILVCDVRPATYNIHVVNKDGFFLSKILSREHGIYTPRGLSYDEKSHLLWFGSSVNRVYVYRYINRDYQTGERN
ncbi:uncharacterized protein LOC133194885 [Saccostrea echinata]|uniref:uncharacterized protein LOC133194885 n=1 Tax=Saccostrea echinata TaxID=191078 RepID=UPI002A7F0C05|nr:uncharacterized protein LOC133194885 [Saccostrea echinata]